MEDEASRDPVTGARMTGHEWDGIRELDKPMPKWWLYVFYATILWSAVYVVLYPALPWPGGESRGLLGYNSRAELAETLEDVRAGRAGILSEIDRLGTDGVLADARLRRFALAGGEAAFVDNCAPCHGVGGTGQAGFPVLADDVWIWGGTPEAIEATIRHGIRWDADEDTRVAEMPAFGGGYLESAAIDEVTEHVLSLSGRAGDPAAAGRGAQTFADECAICHGGAGEGIHELGAPRLSDVIWLHGGGGEEIRAQISRPRHGVMPSWGDRLDPATIRMLTIYVHALGAGG